MHTIITAAIIIAGTIGISIFFILINKRNAGKRSQALINKFNKIAFDEGLVFSNREVLKNKILGLDDIHQKLLIYDFQDTDAIINIDLLDVKDCRLEKEYEKVDFGNAGKFDIEQQLRAIVIRFRFRRGPDFFSISFYDNKVHSIYEMHELESKARVWEVLLTETILMDREGERMIG